ncbi:MAG: hypothetical protein ABJN40_05605 [Sneathiella sp.]
MKYIQPEGSAEDASYIDHDVTPGVLGSIPPATAFEHPQREILHVIDKGGLIPDEADLTQLYKAIDNLIKAAAPALSADALVVEGVSFSAPVVDGDVIYYNDGNNIYGRALSGVNAPSGIADVTNSRVYISGKLPAGLLSGLTPGTYYVSDTVAGAITTTPPASDPIKIGYAISGNVLNVDIEDGFNQMATTLIAGLVLKSTLSAKASLNNSRYLSHAQAQKLIDDAIVAHEADKTITNTHNFEDIDGIP